MSDSFRTAARSLGCDVDFPDDINRSASRRPRQPFVAVAPHIVKPGQEVAAPFSARSQSSRLAAAILVGHDDGHAICVLADHLRTEMADVVLVKRRERRAIK